MLLTNSAHKAANSGWRVPHKLWQALAMDAWHRLLAHKYKMEFRGNEYVLHTISITNAVTDFVAAHPNYQ